MNAAHSQEPHTCTIFRIQNAIIHSNRRSFFGIYSKFRPENNNDSIILSVKLQNWLRPWLNLDFTNETSDSVASSQFPENRFSCGKPNSVEMKWKKNTMQMTDMTVVCWKSIKLLFLSTRQQRKKSIAGNKTKSFYDIVFDFENCIRCEAMAFVLMPKAICTNFFFVCVFATG